MTFVIESIILSTIYILISSTINVNYRARRIFDVSIFGYIVLIPYLLSSILGNSRNLVMFISIIPIVVLAVFIVIYLVNHYFFRKINYLSRAYTTLGSLSILLILSYLPSIFWPNGIERNIQFDKNIIVIQNSKINIFTIFVVVVFALYILSILIGPKSHFGLRVRAFMDDTLVAKSNGISATSIELFVSLITAVCVVLVGVLYSTQSFISPDHMVFVSLGSLCVSYISMKRSLWFVFISAVVIGFMVKVVSTNIDVVSSVYRDTSHLLGTKSTAIFTSDLALVVVPFVVVILASFMRFNKEIIDD